jgi:hypothetical protein
VVRFEQEHLPSRPEQRPDPGEHVRVAVVGEDPASDHVVVALKGKLIAADELDYVDAAVATRPGLGS